MMVAIRNTPLAIGVHPSEGTVLLLGFLGGNPRVAFSSSTLDPVAPRSYNVGWRVQRVVAPLG
jgi:hypothetical protein